jgi:hypothetical protein
MFKLFVTLRSATPWPRVPRPLWPDGPTCARTAPDCPEPAGPDRSGTAEAMS